MGGIAGWVDPVDPLAGGGRVVRRMTDALVARGSGGEGLFVGVHAILGHRRLAAGGHQPVVLGDDGGEPLVVLSYSGEVVNHVDLRFELELLGHKFRTGTDTEVVLHACQEWGIGAAERLDGVYAFAVWDAVRRRLLLVRDRLGVKPLCYSGVGSGVVFASEPKALFASGLVESAVDERGLRDLLASVRTPGGSLYRDVRELPPGHVLVVDGSGVRDHRYWALEARPHTDDGPTTAARTRDLLVDITARHVRADVPPGVLLSGGLDSGVLVELGRKALRGTTVRTFSAGSAHKGVVDHRDLVLDPAELGGPALREAIVTARDAPSTGNGDASLLLLFRAVREHVGVVLSGEGADEVFGGHPWFHDPEALAAADYPWPHLAGCRALLRADVAAELDLTAHRAEHYRQALADVPVLAGEPAVQRRTREVSALHLAHWLPDLLDRQDRLSTAVGLEVRLPFCDHRLVEYAFNTPWSRHTAGGRAKSLLRAAAAADLPSSVPESVKVPSPNPRVIRDQVGDLLATPSAPVWSYLDPAAVRKRSSRPDVEFALSFDVWLRSGPARASSTRRT
ncbi:asparagine synthase (glutamine-hydrolyzing) [Umezawaea sp. NPDC059074]|uniref:asparagine synthase (glutamine-hydrolyzing) n=1 Tax=Umezawaea sp. NPDC059074 TaxID=3346716 RepID=UPI0036851859